MLPNDELSKYGEPPTDESEMALADLLAEALGVAQSQMSAKTAVAGEPQALIATGERIEEMIGTLLAGSGILHDLPALLADVPPLGVPDLRLRVLRQTGSATFVPVASTERPAERPTIVRDLRRVPADLDRTTLSTGDRVRIEALSDQDGYLVVLNVGPIGAVHVLYPEDAAVAARAMARQPVWIADVELVPPAGTERLYAVWSRLPLVPQEVARLVRPETTLRDMSRVPDALSRLRPEDWHAVVMELRHDR